MKIHLSYHSQLSVFSHKLVDVDQKGLLGPLKIEVLGELYRVNVGKSESGAGGSRPKFLNVYQLQMHM